MKIVSRSLRIAFEPALMSVRQETLRGHKHTVYPVVALVEGVLHASSSDYPELALASEFGMFPEGWNGRPVLVSHPQIEGAYVSASYPQIWDTDVIGLLFNTILEGQKLKSEIWVNEDWASNAQDQETIQNLRDGAPLEVSVGLFTQVQPVTGKYASRPFRGIWRNVTPDHLAILPLGVRGACSTEAGCGVPRINQDQTTLQDCNMSQTTSSELHVNCSSDPNCSCNGEEDKGGAAVVTESKSPMDRFFESLVGAFTRMNMQSAGQVLPVPSTELDVETAVEPAAPATAAATSTDMESMNGPDKAERQGTSAENVDIVNNQGKEGEGENKIVDKAATLEALQEVTEPELFAQVQQGMEMLRAHRDVLTTRILATARNKFAKEDLDKMNISVLENIAAIAGTETVASFEGRAAGASDGEEPTAAAAVNGVMPPPKIFAGKKSA